MLKELPVGNIRAINGNADSGWPSGLSGRQESCTAIFAALRAGGGWLNKIRNECKNQVQFSLFNGS